MVDLCQKGLFSTKQSLVGVLMNTDENLTEKKIKSLKKQLTSPDQQT